MAPKSVYWRFAPVRTFSSPRAGRCRGLGGGLRGAADDHGEKALPPQPLGGLLASSSVTASTMALRFSM